MLKLEYLFTEDVYIGAIIILRKKNGQSLLFTTMDGEIVGVNKKCKSLLGAPGYQPESLFALIPRLFPLYFPLGVNHDQSVSLFTSQAHTSLYRKTVTFDCFLFQMFANLVHEKSSVFAGQEYVAKDPKHRRLAQILWDRIRRHVRYRKEVPRKAGFINRLLMKNKQLIVDNASKILRISMNIECHRYQQGIEIWELCLNTVDPSERRMQNFFKYFAASGRSDLIEILKISPESLVNMCSHN